MNQKIVAVIVVVFVAFIAFQWWQSWESPMPESSSVSSGSEAFPEVPNDTASDIDRDIKAIDIGDLDKEFKTIDLNINSL